MLPKEQTGKVDKQTKTLHCEPILISNHQTTQAIKDTKNNNSGHRLPHRNVQSLPEPEHHPSNLETCKNHPNSQSKQIPWSGNLIQNNFTALTSRQNHGKYHSSVHHRKHTKQSSPTWFQDTPLHLHSFTPTHKPNHIFNKPQSPDRTIVVSLDLSKAFDTV